MAIDWHKPWAPVFLLRIDARGSYTYLSTEPVVLTDADGNEYAYRSGLQPLEWSYKLNLGEFSASSDTVSVQFTNPFNEDFAHAVNCYALDLATLQGELSLYVNGAYEDRIILASGRLQRLRWGYEGDSIEAQILINPFRFQRLIPPVPQVVDARRWENAPENVLGAQYPWVFGSPGSSTKPSHPALNVDTNKWLVAGHALSDATAYVFNRTTGATTTKAIATEADGRGQTVSTISYTAADDDEVWVSVEGGLAGSNPADQLAYCLDAADIPYQQSTLAGLRGVLAAYRTGFVLNDQTDAWSLAQDRILSLLPLSMQTIANVVDFRHVKPVPTAQDVVANWDVQRGDCTLVQRPELVEADICNRVTLTYAPDPSASTAVTLIVTGLGETADSDAGLSVSPNALADLSQGRLGKFDKQLSTDAVWDAATAGRVAHDAIDLFALPAIEVSYDLHPSLGRYKVGDVVQLTDSDFAWSNKGFRIVELTYSLAGVSARLRSIEHPSWQQLATCAAAVFPNEPDSIVAISAGGQHSMALKSDGTVWAWGDNAYGQLGDGTTTGRTSPVQVLGLTDIIAISAGDYHSIALKSDGTVWAWGSNGHGQLGDGTTSDRNIPVAVNASNLTGAVAIAAGYYHSLAIRASDNTVWAWGNNANGQLGDGTTTHRTSPVAVVATNLTIASAIAAGGLYSLAIRASDNTVWAWGNNGGGQLGDGTGTSRTSPVAVVATNLTIASAIAAGGSYSLAIRVSDNTVWAWGYNGYGQLGDGTTTQRTTPVAVNASNLTGAVAIAAGDYHSLAIRASDNTVWAWGNNANGQLGDGTTTHRTSPVAVTFPP